VLDGHAGDAGNRQVQVIHRFREAFRGAQLELAGR
jgi:hypothetical protein